MRRRTNVLLATSTAVALVGSGAVAVNATAAAPASTKVTTVTATQDAYVDATYPNRKTGTSKKLVASKAKRNDKLALVQFKVPAAPKGYVVASAHLALKVTRTSSAKVSVAKASNSWSEQKVTYRNKGALGATVASTTLKKKQKSVELDVTKSLPRSGSVSFAVTVPQGVTALSAKESGKKSAPKLVVTFKRKPAQPAPAPKPSAPTTPGTSTPTPAPSTSAPAPAPSTGGPVESDPAPAPSTPSDSRTTTAFGTTAQPRNGTLAEAVARQDAKFGHLATLRYYAPGLPPAWSKITSLGKRDLVVSFKANPSTILSGSQDANLTQWFASAPRDRKIWWTYFHEPENDVESGSFTPTQFRDAFRHVSQLAQASGRDDLRATMILMGYTANPKSGRNWRDYYPGGQYVDVLAWDAYNHAAAKGKSYSTPDAVFGFAVDASAAAGKPMALAETGAPLLDGDNGTGRAAYLKAAGQFLKSHGAEFVTYYDSTRGGAYTLDDQPSIDAWKALM
jgi:hypothetical protein